jgi:broad specificity phosphatase PhoE
VSRILLVRHGVSAHVHDGSWVNAQSARRFIEQYDAAGIMQDEPPQSVVEAAAKAEVLAASTLPRAIESVRRLAPTRQALTTPLLREISFESPNWWPIRLPIPVWDAIDHAFWGYQILRRLPTPELERAREAADWLISQVGNGSTLLAVTHGGFRRFLTAALIDRAWEPESKVRLHFNWSVWSFRPHQ